MKKLLKQLLQAFGIQIIRLRSAKRERLVALHPDHPPQGTVLLSWRLEPFTLMPGEPIPNSHTQYWECAQIARTFLDMGFAVDVIDSHNQTFHPTKPYVCFIGHRINFDRLAGLLKQDCIKTPTLTHRTGCLITARPIAGNSNCNRERASQSRKAIGSSNTIWRLNMRTMRFCMATNLR